jgi:hypothetical protein
MAGTHGKSAKLMGYGFDLTSYFRQASAKGDVAVADKSVFGNTDHDYDIGRQSGGTISAGGLYSDGTGDIQRKLETFKGTVGNMIMLPDGYSAIGRDYTAVQGTLVKHGVNMQQDDMVDAACEVTGKYGLEIGRTLNAFTSNITGAGSQTAVDFGDAFAAPSGATGVVSGCAYLICTAFTGTSVTFTVEDSSDGATGWATVGTFTAVTAANTEQRIALTAGTLKRYLRVTAAGTFTIFTGLIGAVKYAD